MRQAIMKHYQKANQPTSEVFCMKAQFLQAIYQRTPSESKLELLVEGDKSKSKSKLI
jgi:hypothetical protein